MINKVYVCFCFFSIAASGKRPVTLSMMQAYLIVLHFPLVNQYLGFLKIHPTDTVEQAHDLYRRIAKGKDFIMYFYVVDENDKLLGVADIRDVLKANDNIQMKAIMDKRLTALKPQSTLREASVAFSRYGYRALPITDEAGKILGVVSYRDMMELKHLFLE